MAKQKIHWLQNPNKNYLGHWDLPNGEDLTLTIKSAKWELVENPETKEKVSKRVIRFKEKGIKPFICNEVNATSIVKSTGINFMCDSINSKITLFVGKYIAKESNEKVDCIRIRQVPPSALTKKEFNIIKLKVIATTSIASLTKLYNSDVRIKTNKDLSEIFQEQSQKLKDDSTN